MPRPRPTAIPAPNPSPTPSLPQATSAAAGQQAAVVVGVASAGTRSLIVSLRRYGTVAAVHGGHPDEGQPSGSKNSRQFNPVDVIRPLARTLRRSNHAGALDPAIRIILMFVNSSWACPPRVAIEKRTAFFLPFDSRPRHPRSLGGGLLAFNPRSAFSRLVPVPGTMPARDLIQKLT